MTTTITSIDGAIERLIGAQIEDGRIPTQPAYADKLETPTGWVFFNVNGYIAVILFAAVLGGLWA